MAVLKEPVILGIDFGTSNSSTSVNINGEVKLIDVDGCNLSNKKVLRSVIYFNNEEKKFFVGQEAVEMYIENDASGRYIQSIKSFLPDKSFHRTEIGGRYYSLDDLIALVLRKIKEAGEGISKREIKDVVLGRPVFFSNDPDTDKFAEKRLLLAAKKAGFENIQLQYEPIAAALDYESALKEGDEKIVLVGDFGGGTSDFAIVRVNNGKQKAKRDRKSDVLSIGGVYIGGDVFDSRIMWEKVAKYFGKDVRIKALMADFTLGMPSPIMNKLRRWHLIPLLQTPKTRQIISEIKHQADRRDLVENLERLIDCNYGYMLFRSIEKSKCELSSQEETNISFDGINLSLKERITRLEFEEIILKEIEEINSCVVSTMREASLSPEKIDAVFLTGGSSLIPCIKRIFEDKFGQDKINQVNAFTSVAYGLGLSVSSV
ncbi:Hsp70 family protein [Candidatus Parcubacteria bacterium]|nr:Hsp70 family protein [Candidatus Parcubacteria bacterium]